MTLVESAAALRAKKISARELTMQSLARLRDSASLNAFITVMEEAALSEADACDREFVRGEVRGPLHGVPVAVKDNLWTKGVRTTGGTRIFADFVPPEDAAVVAKLREAGAIILGKTNLHEWAYGVTSNNPHYGPVRNPHNLECIAGGSSGGSGAAVAAGIVPVAIGTDTGGSIRIPAAYCGVVGMKPSYGVVSRYGCHPLGLTLDHVGPLTRTVADAALVMQAIVGVDPRDLQSVPTEPSAYRAREDFSLTGLRIGRPDNFYFDRLDPGVGASVDDALKKAAAEGAEIVPCVVPDIAGLNAIARVILMSEASAIMSKYRHRRGEMGADVRALFDQGCLVPATDYVNAQRARLRKQQEFAELFQRIDVLATPAAPIGAPQIGASTVAIEGVEEDTRLATTRLVRGVNVLGLPALSLPCGLTRAGMPAGLQLIANAFCDGMLLDAARAIERLVSYRHL